MVKSKEKSKKKIDQELNMIVDDLLLDVEMTDWTVKVKYKPDPESKDVAAVDFNIHKEADITVSDYNKDTIRDDLRHELVHCKVGLIRKSYEVVIEGLNDIIDNLVQKNEEYVVDSVCSLIKGYQGNGQGKQ